jgi:hypothetical protein
VQTQVPEKMLQTALGHASLAATDRFLRGPDRNVEALREVFAKLSEKDEIMPAKARGTR